MVIVDHSKNPILIIKAPTLTVSSHEPSWAGRIVSGLDPTAGRWYHLYSF